MTTFERSSLCLVLVAAFGLGPSGCTDGENRDTGGSGREPMPSDTAGASGANSSGGWPGGASSTAGAVTTGAGVETGSDSTSEATGGSGADSNMVSDEGSDSTLDSGSSEDTESDSGACVPDCGGLSCGPDRNCGRSCGVCDSGESCHSGTCVDPNADSVFFTACWHGRLTSASMDSATLIRATEDGGFFLGGKTRGRVEGGEGMLGGEDIVLARYDRDGRQIWLKQLGSSGDDIPREILETEHGIYLLVSTTEAYPGADTSFGRSDIVLAKLDASGDQIWVRQIGTHAHDGAWSMVPDQAGNLVVAGSTGTDFGDHAWSGASDILIISFSPAGDVQWTIQHGGQGGEGPGAGIVIDEAQNIYVAGSTDGSFDGQPIVGQRDFFVLKWNAQRERQWTRIVGGTGDDDARAIALGRSGEIYVAGATEDGFGGVEQNGTSEAFLTRWSPDGQLEWTKGLGTEGYDAATELAVDASGLIYMTGVVGQGLLPPMGTAVQDMLVVRYRGDGSISWLHQVGTLDYDIGQSFDILPNGQLLLAGATEGELPGVGPAQWRDIVAIRLCPS